MTSLLDADVVGPTTFAAFVLLVSFVLHAVYLPGDARRWDRAWGLGTALGVLVGLPLGGMVDFFVNFCIFECGPHDPVGVYVGFAAFAISIAGHLLVAWLKDAVEESPLPDVGPDP